jgi:hypothetical protein
MNMLALWHMARKKGVCVGCVVFDRAGPVLVDKIRPYAPPLGCPVNEFYVTGKELRKNDLKPKKSGDRRSVLGKSIIKISE